MDLIGPVLQPRKAGTFGLGFSRATPLSVSQAIEGVIYGSRDRIRHEYWELFGFSI
jgi:hypothetical protein